MIDELGTVIELPGDRLRLEWAEILRNDPCAYCGGPGGTVDHIVPLLRKTKKGGGETATTLNGTGSCSQCNGQKKNLKLLEFLLDPEGAHEANRIARRNHHIREQLKRKIFSDEQMELLERMVS